MPTTRSGVTRGDRIQIRVRESRCPASRCRTPGHRRRCFHIDPVIMKCQANLWNDALRGGTMLDGLPRPPLHSYNSLAMGLEWDNMEHDHSDVGRGMPVEVVIEDRAMLVCQSATH